MEEAIKVFGKNLESPGTVGSVRDPNLGFPGELLHPGQGAKSTLKKGINFWEKTGGIWCLRGILWWWRALGAWWKGILGSVKSQEWLVGSDPRCEFQELEPQVLPTERFDFSVPIPAIPAHQWEAGCSWKSMEQPGINAR